MKPRLDIVTAISQIVQNQATGQEPDNQLSGSDAVGNLAASILQLVNDNPEDFPSLLRIALEEVTHRTNHASLAVTGMSWLGSGVPSVDQEMTSLVRGARREIVLCAYSITAGGMTFLRELRDVAAQGVLTTIIVNRFVRQPPEIQSYLTDPLRTIPQYWRVLDFVPASPHSELHAKVLAVDRVAALVGSANVSFHGMFSSHEMAVVLRGPLAESVAARLDMLAHSNAVRDVKL